MVKIINAEVKTEIKMTLEEVQAKIAANIAEAKINYDAILKETNSPTLAKLTTGYDHNMQEVTEPPISEDI